MMMSPEMVIKKKLQQMREDAQRVELDETLEAEQRFQELKGKRAKRIRTAAGRKDLPVHFSSNASCSSLFDGYAN